MAAGVLDKSIVLVGGQTGQTTLSRVDAYNVETKTWTRLRSLPAPRELVLGATPINGKLYVAGGRAGSTTDFPDEKTLFVYDPTTNTWTRKADMPRAGCTGVQANVRGQLYVYTLCGTSDDLTLFAKYNPSTDKWVRLPLPDRPDEQAHQGGPVAGAIDGKFYLTGGIDAWGRPDRVLHVYDPATETWTTKSPMPTGRDGAFAAVFHGKLFVAGGLVWPEGGSMVATDVVEAYDPVSDSWSTGPSMLAPRSSGASASAGGRFYAMGGVEASGSVSNSVEALSTPSGSALTFNGTWRTMPSLQPARWRHAADVLGKSIVVVGGLSGDELHALSRVDAFNVETRTWTALKSLPIPLYDVNGATPVQGKLYVSGGRSSPDEDCAKTLFVYDPATNSWTRKADMPLKGCVGVQAHVLGQLYVYTFPQSPPDIRLFASYNPKTDKWVRRPLPKGLHFAYPVAGAINEKFYLTSGEAFTGLSDRELEVYDPATRTWTTKSPMPTGRSVASAAVLHGKLFVAGGVVDRNGLAVVTGALEAYDPLSDTWATGPSMPTPRAHAASAWAGGRFYTIDGIRGGPLTSVVEALSTSY
jgi:N-acetylneuraminic acid mutarotase